MLVSLDGPYIEENFISLSECQRLIDYARLNKSENVSRDDVYSTDIEWTDHGATYYGCLLYTSPSPRDLSTSRMPSSA